MVVGDGNDAVAHICLSGRHAVDVANARLIAAAPELLAALKELAKYWECGTSVSAGSLVALDALAAIARAESRT